MASSKQHSNDKPPTQIHISPNSLRKIHLGIVPKHLPLSGWYLVWSPSRCWEYRRLLGQLCSSIILSSLRPWLHAQKSKLLKSLAALFCAIVRRIACRDGRLKRAGAPWHTKPKKSTLPSILICICKWAIGKTQVPAAFWKLQGTRTVSWLDFLAKSVGFTKYGVLFCTNVTCAFHLFSRKNPPQNRTDLNSRAYRNNGPNRNKSAAIPELVRFWWWPDGIEITAAALANHASRSTNDLCYSFVQTKDRNWCPSSWRFSRPHMLCDVFLSFSVDSASAVFCPASGNQIFQTMSDRRWSTHGKQGFPSSLGPLGIVLKRRRHFSLCNLLSSKHLPVIPSVPNHICAKPHNPGRSNGKASR